MMLTLAELDIEEGVSIFVYPEDRSTILGPVTEVWNGRPYQSNFVNGESLVLEINVETNPEKPLPVVHLIDVVHDFMGVVNTEGGANGSLLPCHYDINCGVASGWQLEKRSVARMFYKKEKKFLGITTQSRTEACTGLLLNNEQSTGERFFLTASHCLEDGAFGDVLGEAQFNFNYECPGCNSGVRGHTHHTVKGAEVVAINQASDFALLRLPRIPSSFNTYHTPWDRSGILSTNATVIHHPKSAEKKVSFDVDPIIRNAHEVFLGGLVFAPNSLLEVRLDDGTTEGGSSGAPVFDSEGRVVGQNIGGNTGCPNGTGILKYGGDLSVSWFGQSSDERLRDWLDPNGTGAQSVNGFEPKGWLHAWIINWNAPSSMDVHSHIKSIGILNEFTAVYRGEDNKVHMIEYVVGSGWQHSWVEGQNAPSSHNVEGDLITMNGQIFYRGVNDKVNVYYQNSIGQWTHGVLGGWSSPSFEDVSPHGSSKDSDGDRRIIYRGEDNKVHVYEWVNSSIGWQHSWIGGQNANHYHDVYGDLITMNGQVFYRGWNKKINVYYRNAVGQWTHGVLGGWGSPQFENVNSLLVL